ncbi:shikimate dehydrogenase (NADP(+)) [Brucella endophytica]|uniref:Shikimate dehydrogenase (NADP(+)) n=1 Tax=Brucella endophytica TaxID=1963359 RepID=A0A916SRD7_9HYPH|nr:shikimate dehydrogenase [Brucella endophytica]GGB12554.1 shikimate dehydrogenase (NADP(+)) [Brucella endophytica]
MVDIVQSIAVSLGKLVAERRQSGSDILVGLVGRSIQLSRTPMMHEREAERLGFRSTYILIDFDRLHLTDDDLPACIAAARKLGFNGLNVTHPFKQRVISCLDDLAAEASAIGAVNTVVFADDGKAIGHNTDCWGFTESFRRGMAGVPLDRVVQFGAGGAGAAVAYALIGLGVKNLGIVDPQAERAGQLAAHLKPIAGDAIRVETDLRTVIATADGLVNTTPMGMAKYPGTPFPAGLLLPRHWVAEIVYFPSETELLRRAGSLDCKVLPGIGMAIGQAVRAFELFTGRAADMNAMASHFEAAA